MKSFLLCQVKKVFNSENCNCYYRLGCLEILEDDDVVVAILSNGDAFGEEVWKQLSNGRKFKKQKSRYYVRALAPTDLRLLKSESLSKVLQFYHQFGESFESKMRLRYT